MQELTTLEQWEACAQDSHKAPVFVLKHSTACPVSAEAYRRVKAYLEEADGQGPAFYLVKVIESRPVSNAIAVATGQEHKSPQLILVKEGKGVWQSSHLNISKGAIEWAITHHVENSDGTSA